MSPPSKYATPASVRLPSPKRKQSSRQVQSSNAIQNDGSHNITGNGKSAALGYNQQPRSPSREEENRIRRGAEIIRRQIQQQLLFMEETIGQQSSPTTSPSHNSNDSRPASVRRKEANRPWKEEFAWKAPSVRREVEALEQTSPLRRVSVLELEQRAPVGGDSDEPSLSETTDFSDPWKIGHDTTANYKVLDPTDSTSTSLSSDVDGFLHEMADRHDRTPIDAPHSYHPLETMPPAPAASRKPTVSSQQAVCFLSSDEDEDDNDILEVKEPMFDTFYEQDLLPVEKNIKAFEAQQKVIKSPISIRSAIELDETCHDSAPECPVFGDAVFTYQEGSRAVVVVPPDRNTSPAMDESSGSSSGPTFPQPKLATEINERYEPATDMGRIPLEPMEVSYPLPRHLESPEKEKGPLKLPDASLVDYDEL
jgi:hypothetical protein